MRKIKLFWAFLALALVGLVAMAVAPAGAARLERIQIEGFAFHPTPLEVSPGELVRVENVDGGRQNGGVPHSVTAFSGDFDTGAFFDVRRFRAPSARGVYQYFCKVHPFMKGTLEVRAGG